MPRVMNIGDEAVRKATGKDWSDWFRLLDKAGARDWGHKRMVAFVAAKGLTKPWWQQMITSSYERVRGLKEVGETSDQGFQIGVQRTVAASKAALWRLLLSPEGLAVWLGRIGRLPLERGAAYATAGGPSGEIRTVRKGERIRMTLQSGKTSKPTTLQVTLACPRNTRNKTTLRFHHEKLASAMQREKMRAHWKKVSARLSEMATQS